MIKKTLITTAILFVLGNVFVLIKGNVWNPSPSFYQQNIVIADQYLYNTSTPKAIILGSSLGARIITDSLPGYYNLSLVGMSIFDGLHILLKKEKLPPIILIETDYLTRPERKDYVDEFDNPVFNFLRAKFPVLRVENQPLGLSYQLIHRNSLKRKPSTDRAAVPKPVDSSLFNSQLSQYVKNFSNNDKNLVNSSIVKLGKYIDEINKRGAKICFIEMPINSKLTFLPLTTNTRRSILENFHQYPFITIPNKKFVTGDGVHLTQPEAVDYTLYLKKKLKELDLL